MFKNRARRNTKESIPTTPISLPKLSYFDPFDGIWVGQFAAF